MRGKRSKQYRRLMDQYTRGFGFREPYQVLIDADLVKDATRCKIELVTRLAQVLHGQIKPIITQCSMRHIYAAANQDRAAGDSLIRLTQKFERRRCGHHPSEYPDPLPEFECIAGVVGTTNKHRYVVATQHGALRRRLREVPGVPLIYVNRSVMILEPMARATVAVLDQGEREKFRGGLKLQHGAKRKREEHDEDDALPVGRGAIISRGGGAGGGEEQARDGGDNDDDEWDGLDGEHDANDAHDDGEGTAAAVRSGQKRQQEHQGQPREPETKKRKKKHKYGPKEPNPLSVRKAKKRPTGPSA